ncbi:MAG: hypothetical protein P0S94_05415 [Simkaniaceae bacterium]|nr:hypothetical protein [Simkaniaceae bacterium]
MSVREPGETQAWRVVHARILAALPPEPPSGGETSEAYDRAISNLRHHAEDYLNPDTHNYLEGKVITSDGKTLLQLDICEGHPLSFVSEKKMPFLFRPFSKRIPIDVMIDEQTRTVYLDPNEITEEFSKTEDQFKNTTFFNALRKSNWYHLKTKKNVYTSVVKRFIFTETVNRTISKFNLPKNKFSIVEKGLYEIYQHIGSPSSLRRSMDQVLKGDSDASPKMARKIQSVQSRSSDTTPPSGDS